MVTQWMSIDGALVQASQAQLPAGLVTASQGQAWFETLRVMDRRVARGPRHVQRALRTAQMLGVQVPEAWLAWAHALADTLPPGLHALRVTFLTAPQRAHVTVVCEARAVEPLLAPVMLLPVMRLDHDDELHAYHKLHARWAWTRARAQAQALGAFDALLVDRQLCAREGTIGNLVALVEGRLCAPVRGVLPGVGRACVLELAERLGLPVEEGELRLADLKRAEAVLLVNAVRLCMPVDGVLHGGHYPESLGWAQRLNALLTQEEP